ncbi:tRNA dihydrouridine synthase DusB [Modestobacter sp. VKM Ac-2986]|uniref:tRNA dihydrouridine synthase DusB n=1 Tax=Modestobacter sp. VKM Ac-2986 TaxID=3004140 RepID=UPI0022AA42DB|nr:tRNA dihydrouridine synthase DusB [Modestobacter sp. VKM Ac-2986]MCZ2828500.1 tRNA dihydrouridine synthase DusB [Modestobacter sp. VKM Ac-2986]
MTSTLERATALPALQLGKLTVDPAVVLAPMAGITGPAFRTLCREFGAGLYVCEMITTRALVERNEKTLRMVQATTDEADAFSVQLYGVDPATVGRAVSMLVDEQVAGTRPAHIDLNFGCPVPKVTRKGGGSALPWRRVLFGNIVRAAVQAAGDVPVTVKTRIGIDPEHTTYLDAGRIAQDAGAAAITLHGRTADQLYSGTADWAPIARLVETVDIPVLGNGDLWEADDALRMVAETGCAGVVVGRGCLGRPWLFADLAAAFAGSTQRTLPDFRQVAAVMHRHATLLVAEHGEEAYGCADFRKHVAWYLKGFAVGSDTRRALAMVSSLDELAELLAGIEDQPYPQTVLGEPRGRTTSARPVSLPEGWLDDRDDPRPPAGAELLVGGG